MIVQGDTTTTFCGALAAFYRGMPVAHVEAGLRTGDFRQPFPEEMNRVLTSRLATLHFAPTEAAAANLRREGVDARRIFVTGNTGIDAVLEVAGCAGSGRLGRGAPADARKKVILVTAHRRESFGDGFRRHLRGAAATGGARRRADCLSGASESQRARGGPAASCAGSATIQLIEPLAIRSVRRSDAASARSADGFRGRFRKRGRRWANRCWCCAKRPSGRRRWRREPRVLSGTDDRSVSWRRPRVLLDDRGGVRAAGAHPQSVWRRPRQRPHSRRVR